MSLPPELGAIDEAWGEDEQPTIARPSRMPTAPERIKIPSEAPTAPGFVLDYVDPDTPETEDDRITTVPEIPLDDFARRAAVRSDVADAQVTEAPPPPLELEAPGMPDLEHIRVRPKPSELPTAPPPLSFKTQMAASRGDVPPPPSLGRLSVEPHGPTYPPPMTSPRIDPPVFSGRFSSAPPDELNDTVRMKGKFAMGDFSGALQIAEKILGAHPRDQDAQSVAKRSREVLLDMYSSRIAGLDRVPRISMGPDQIRWLSLDHRAGFLLSMIDGISSIDDLLDVSGMPRLDALRILCELLEAKVIALSSNP